MNIAYFNETFIPKDDVKISPDDRGFLFADGIYEVVRWYKGFFYDMDSHVSRLKRSLNELKIFWHYADSFPEIAKSLIEKNNLSDKDALVYLQITRGVAPRTHHFPRPEVSPTSYSFVKEFNPDTISGVNGVAVMLKKEIRWKRCDIKSVALLPNTLCFEEAFSQGFYECIFVRDGIITEGSHSNIFFVIDNIIYTHPESNHILAGVTRKNVIRIAKNQALQIRETALNDKMLGKIDEAFLSNTGAEITPIIFIGNSKVGNGNPGKITNLLRKKFHEEILLSKA